MERLFGGGDDEALDEDEDLNEDEELDDTDEDDEFDGDDDEPEETDDGMGAAVLKKRIDPEADDITHAIDCALDDTCTCRDE